MALHEASLVLPLSGRAAVLLNLSDRGQLLGNKRLAVAPVRSKPRRRLRGEHLSTSLRNPRAAPKSERALSHQANKGQFARGPLLPKSLKVHNQAFS